jgi:hypothetical protein
MTRARAPPPHLPRLSRHPTCARAVARNGRPHLRARHLRTSPKRCVPFGPTTKPNSMTSSLSSSQFALCASAGTSMTSRAAPHHALGMTNTMRSQNASGRACSPKQANNSARDGRNPVDGTEAHRLLHFCSGCGAKTHGAQRCPRAQDPLPSDSVQG